MEVTRENATHQRNMKKDFLKKELEQLRLDTPVRRRNGIHPIQIFPEELWLKVLQNVTEVEDIASCSRANVFLDKTLNASKPELLFPKIFPTIFDKLKTAEVLACRRVCKTWRSGVDSYLENGPECVSSSGESTLRKPFTGTCTKKRTKDLFKVKFFYFFGIGNLGIPFPSSKDLIRSEMKNHSKNPFVSRTVFLTSAFGVNLQNYLDDFLNDFGKHIWNFGITKATQLNITADGFHAMCHSILTKCPHLKSLILVDFDVLTGDLLSVREPFPDHHHLKILLFAKSGPVDKLISAENPVQDLLVEKYSNQLKYVRLSKWISEVYPNLDWNNLKLLDLSDTSKGLLQKSGENPIKTCGLLRIYLKFDYSGAEVKDAIRRINDYFPKLERLNLDFAGVTGLTSDDFLTQNPNDNMSCNSSVTCLTLNYVQKCGISYDILAYFPHLKRLQLNFHTKPRHPKVEFAPINQNLDIVQIEKYIWGNAGKESAEIYKSNVWEVLPRLEFLVIGKETEDDEDQDDVLKLRTVTYSRGFYDYNIMAIKNVSL